MIETAHKCYDKVKAKQEKKMLDEATRYVLWKKLFLEITQNSHSQCLFFDKVVGLRCFPVNFAKFLRTPFLQKTSG